MAQTYGTPGGATKRAVIRSAAKRHVPSAPRRERKLHISGTPNLAPSAGNCSGAGCMLAIAFLCFITYQFRWMLIFAGLALVVYVLIGFVGNVDAYAVPAEEASSGYRVLTEVQRETAAREYQLLAAGNATPGYFTAEERKAASRAEQERSTAAELASLPETYTVINGVTVRSRSKEDNIDHVVLSPHGPLAIFDVAWDGEFAIHTEAGEPFIPYTNLYRKEIEECQSRAHTLPVTLQGVIFVVAGGVGDAIAADQRLIYATHKAEKSIDTETIVALREPIFFVAQRNIARYVEAIGSSVAPQVEEVSFDAFKNYPGITF